MMKHQSASTGKKAPYASFIRRAVAVLIDGLIVAIVNFGILFASGSLPKVNANSGSTALQYVISFLVSFAYFVGFLVNRNGQTPGKSMLHIRVMREDGSDMDVFTASVREVSKYVSMLPLYLGYFWVLFDGRRQAWHDKIARTVVVESDDVKPSTAVYALGCLVPVLMIGAMSAAFAVGFTSALMSAKNNPGVSIKKSLNEMKPEAKTHYDRSQELFKQMHASSDDKAAITKLNDENITELKKALEAEPGNARIWYELGNAYTWVSSNGTTDDMLAAYKKAESLEPENTVYINGVGDAYIMLERYQEAVLEFQKTLRISDGSGYAHKSLGVAYGKLKIYDSAREHLERALEIFKQENNDGSYDKTILETQTLLSQIPKN